ncbi:MAG: TlpA family protein disulfide reductase [Bacteroidetes bacterium]|nr:TlpA family protein disulfide reductase [Bacteroidota bacterium]MCH8940826.1 TlpA family protein disulfide reductase [Bacteroidota bacterium]
MKFKVLLSILFFSSIIIAGCGNKAPGAAPVKKSEPVVNQIKDDAVKSPDFELINTDGKKVKLSDYKGKIIILNFWATWCPPCREEIPGFVKLQKEYKDDLVILGVSLDIGSKDDVVPFMKKFQINYPVLFGTMEVVSDYGDIQSIPTTFVIDQKGNIVNSFIGYREESVFKAEIEKLLKKS